MNRPIGAVSWKEGIVARTIAIQAGHAVAQSSIERGKSTDHNDLALIKDTPRVGAVNRHAIDRVIGAQTRAETRIKGAILVDSSNTRSAERVVGGEFAANNRLLIVLHSGRLHHVVCPGRCIIARNRVGHTLWVPFTVCGTRRLIIKEDGSTSHIHIRIHRWLATKRNKFHIDVLVKFHVGIIQDRYRRPCQRHAVTKRNRRIDRNKILGIGDGGGTVGHRREPSVTVGLGNTFVAEIAWSDPASRPCSTSAPGPGRIEKFCRALKRTLPGPPPAR